MEREINTTKVFMLKDLNILFADFVGRKESLQKIKRYHPYSPMLYRPDVFFHSLKVFHLVHAVIPLIQKRYTKKFDAEKLLVMALVHDDPEMVTGDFQAGHKAKMNVQQQNEILEKEERAVEILVQRFPKKIGGYSYKDLLLETIRKDTFESQVMKYIDHLDGFCEAMHELYAGNDRFLRAIHDPELGLIELPHEYYIKRFNLPFTYYPLLEDLFSGEVPFLKEYSCLDFSEIVKNGKPHTEESLSKSTGNSTYDWWKKVLIQHLSHQEIENLFVQKEFN